MAQDTKKTRVAVLGLGLTGVTTVKNLVEIGLDAVGFDKNGYIGGLWQWTKNPNQTSILKSMSIHSCFQDFPFPDDVADYPPGEDVLKYIQAYASHYSLHDHFRLGWGIERVERTLDDGSWLIKSISTSGVRKDEVFDKVIVTTGPYAKAFLPKIDGQDHFKGKILHSQAFKDPADFAGQRVIVAGLAQTGGDVAVDLVGVASQVYMSHRSGARVIRRGSPKPTDHRISRRVAGIAQTLNAKLPGLMFGLGAFMTEKGMIRMHPEYQKSWNLLPAPPLYNSPPSINDHIISKFADGTIIPIRGSLRIKAPSSPGEKSSTVELPDGTSIPDIDAIIFATGYQSDFSIFAPEADPTAFPTPEWDASPHSNGLLYPRLYQGIFSIKYPQSLAFIGPYRGQSFAAFNNGDLISQAVTQVFAGNYTLPPQAEMEAWCDANYQSNLEQIKKWRITKVGVSAKQLEAFLNDAAGNEVNEKLGWGLEAWRFWWSDRELYRLIVDGINSPYLYRLFDGRAGSRKKWEGAREAIFKVNGRALKEHRTPAAGQKLKD
ncbi:FAD/NAD(P)-binding domain-containing protein [Pseudovirgaria hyperparasitica]|uniref:FAD/NAD(P)-binding domain-containing protein n=1 Tax=Pseudovirgaria hyperparasitica TaxID=470096 RepID=A0A6A6WKA1_9PEZI|nr:FAD/NAD(P)-binding domain-containing protein [Pseudovirgaria hyperparasitica]KAF2762583.1 FAD/NAD(P)-binding domain-containing protein [Pseudovirgaria hyperparasitica]